MAFLSALANMNKLRGIEDAFGGTDITSTRMKGSIRQWFDLYYDRVYDRKGELDTAQNIPYIVVDELCKAAFGEYTYDIDASSKKGMVLKTMLAALDKVRPEAFQKSLIGGEGFIKPVIRNGEFAFVFIDRMSFAVLGRDLEGNIDCVGTSEVLVKGKNYYTLMEKRSVDSVGYLTIESKLYKSDSPDELGARVSLQSISEYAMLEPVIVLPLPLFGLGLIPVRTPMANCVDGSADGVAIYAAAVDKILEAYRHERRTEDEFELTEPHLVASIDVQARDQYGRLLEIPKYITAVDDDPGNVGMTVYNPTPHQQELEARGNQNMRQLEDILGFRRGTLSYDSAVRNSREIEVYTSNARYALSIKSFQNMWTQAVNEAVRTCDLLGQVYLGWDAKEAPGAVTSWGDGVLYDEQEEYERLYQLVSAGYVKPEILVAWMYDIDIKDENDMERVRREYMPDTRNLDFASGRYAPGAPEREANKQEHEVDGAELPDVQNM